MLRTHKANWPQHGRLTNVLAVEGNKDVEDTASTQYDQTGDHSQLQDHAAFGPDVGQHQLHFGQDIGPGACGTRTAAVVAAILIK